ncbi:MAG: carbamoyltransferase [Magnetococcales bacterium]|nr:carbamoyltransferase [Magnetococcales bacterium]
MNILGINAYHGDSAACLVMDGELMAAAEEERFTRIKHWAGFPARSIRFCLDHVGLQLDAINVIAINSNPRANLGRKIAYVLRQRPEIRLVLERLKSLYKRETLLETLGRELPGPRFTGRLIRVEHHLAHLASAYYVSPFREALAVSVDGFGDFASSAWGPGQGTALQVEGRVLFPHSLGLFYQSLTQFLGFPSYGDEYKVMGLAPYGQPTRLAELERIVHLQDDGGFRLNPDYFRYHRESVDYHWESGSPVVGTLYASALEELLGPARQPGAALEQHHMDLARSVQAMYEKALFHLLVRLHHQYPLDTLCLAGGCAMNSVANGRILARTPFKRVYIPSAAGDAGGAVGAAFVAWLQDQDRTRRFVMDHACWGPRAARGEVEQLLEDNRDRLAADGCTIQWLELPELLTRTVTHLVEGRVVGWYQGRMEWGPRALGNRSILCDPRRADMKEILNLKIKRRESFRPFAPAILREAVADWFETEDDVPFMMQVFQIRPGQRARIPAVTHVDGSGRLQTVTRAANPRYYDLIRQFGQATGVPILLNTSFNENEPVVCRPAEALDCFLRTRMDCLVLEDCLVERAG